MGYKLLRRERLKRPGHKTLYTESEQETERLGERLARGLKKGSVVALSGELGAGKTTLVRGMARGLAIEGYVKSPSFTIVHIYSGGRLPLYHIDLYRIAPEELNTFELEEYVWSEGVCVIEWAEKIRHILPEDTIYINITHEGENRRKIEMEGFER